MLIRRIIAVPLLLLGLLLAYALFKDFMSTFFPFGIVSWAQIRQGFLSTIGFGLDQVVMILCILCFWGGWRLFRRPPHRRPHPTAPQEAVEK